jgi:hypothetical protein
MTYNYQAFGLYIQTNFTIDELKICDEHDIDIHMTMCKLNEYLELGDITKLYEGDLNRFVIRVPKIAIFVIEQGQRIEIYPAEQAHIHEITTFLLGSVIGACMIQRSRVILHGSVVNVNQQAIAFCGESGVGKSTLLMNFLQAGYTFLSDDMAAITCHEAVPYVHPAYPSTKLWIDTLHSLSIDHSTLKSVYDRDLKFKLSLESSMSHLALPIHTIYVIEKQDARVISVQEQLGIQKVLRLIEYSYRFNFVVEMKAQGEHLKSLSPLVNHLKIFLVHRPKSMSAYDFFTYIHHHIQEVHDDRVRIKD